MRILVVDDEDLVLDTISAFLKDVGHEVLLAENGDEAIRIIDNTPDIDVVITDVVMPSKDGIETILCLNKKHPSIKVIAISGGGQVASEEYLAMAKSIGATKVLKKPFTKKDLIDLLDGIA